MSVKTCPECGSLQARGQFCTECGYDLSDVKPRELVYENVPPRREYRALRFAGGLLVLVGWLMILASVIGAVYNYAEYSASGAIVVQGQGPQFSDNRFITPDLAALMFLVVGVPFGLLNIAAGQMAQVLVDIFDDVRRIARK